MRKIPHTMATQHPDNASKHHFSGKRFVDTSDEVEECFYSFSELKCQEYMWDWEGKHVDEAVIEKLIEKHLDFFKKNQLGKDVFLTFRIPNIWKEKGYRLARAFVNIIAANDFMDEMQLHTPPIFEAIFPMTASGEKLFFIRSKYAESVKAFEIMKESGPKSIEPIPLIEEPSLLLSADKILEEYVSLCTSSSFRKESVEYMRPFIARSDPALVCGLIPAVISAKAALSRFSEFSEKSSIPTYPIIGVGCLPFRGHLTPYTVESFSKEYAGVRTVTLQSAFRADYPEKDVKSAVTKLSSSLSSSARVFSEDEIGKIAKLNAIFTKSYVSEMDEILPQIHSIVSSVPARRERKQHIGLLSYARTLGKHTLPRAIPFTCAFYSLGVPPEFIGTGRALKEAREHKLFDFLLEIYRNIEIDLKTAGSYLNRENLASLSESSKGWKQIAEDVKLVEELLDAELGPSEEEHFGHMKRTSKIFSMLSKKEDFSGELEKAAEIRRSLG